MRYPNKLYLEFRKRPENYNKGISAGQTIFIRNFYTNSVNIATRQNHPQSGINYKITSLKDYPKMIELEFTRIDIL